MSRRGTTIGLWVLTGLVFAFVAFTGVTSFLKGRTGDYIHLYHAGEAVLQGEDIYASHEGKFVYPSTLALLFAPQALLPYETAGALWAFLNTTLMAVGLLLVVRILQQIPELQASWTRLAMAGAACATAFVLADKFLGGVKLGQTDSVEFLLVLGGLILTGKRPLTAGLLLGLAFNLKYRALIFLPYLLFRRDFKTAGAFAGGAILFAILPAVFYGWDDQMAYLTTAHGALFNMGANTTAHLEEARIFGLTWIRSVSLPSAFGRMTELAGGPTSLAFGLVGLVGLGLLAIWQRMYARADTKLFRVDPIPSGQAPDLLRVTEWFVLTGAMLAFSPQSTTRHFFHAMGLIFLTVVAIQVSRGTTRWVLVGLLTTFAVVINFPGANDALEEVVTGLRWIGAASWAVLAMALGTTWAVLQFLQTGYPRTDTEGSNPPLDRDRS